jgi:hypothetical protein
MPSTMGSWAAFQAVGCAVTWRVTRSLRAKSRWKTTGALRQCGHRCWSWAVRTPWLIVLTVWGDGRTYKLNFRTDSGFDGVNYQAAFTPSPGSWTQTVLPLAAFSPTFRGRLVQRGAAVAAPTGQTGWIDDFRQASWGVSVALAEHRSGVLFVVAGNWRDLL